MQARLITNVEERLQSPTPCCTQTNWKHCRETCDPQTSIEEFRKCSEYEVPLCPFLLLLHRLYFKMLSPSMFEVGLPFCFHPYYCGSRYMCHGVDILQKCWKPTTNFRIFFKRKWDEVSFCNNGLREYLWQMII